MSRKAVFLVRGALCVALILTATAGAWAYDLDEVIAEALRSNPEVSAAAESADEAAAAIGSVFEIDNSRLSMTGNYRQNDGGTDMGGSASLSVPIIPQLSLNGSVSVAEEPAGVDGTVSVAINPFAARNTFTTENGVYEKALIQLDHRIREVEAQAEAVALDWIVASRRVAEAEDSLRLQEEEYEIARQTYDLGDATYEDLQDARQSASAARRQNLAARSAYIAAEKALTLLLGPSVRRSTGMIETTVDEPPVEELLGRIENRDRLVEAADAAVAANPEIVWSRDIESTQIDLETLEARLDETWQWRPALSLQGSYGVGSGAIAASVTLSISASDFALQRREDILSDIEDLRDTIDTEQFSVVLDREAARQSVSISREELEVARIDLEQAELSVAEMEVLTQQGERRELELRQARVSLRAAETAVLQAAGGVLQSQSDYLLYFSLDQ